MNSKDMQGKDTKKNRKEKKIRKDAKKNGKEKNIRIKDNTLRLFDCNNTLEIFTFLECSNHRLSHDASCAIDE